MAIRRAGEPTPPSPSYGGKEPKISTTLANNIEKTKGTVERLLFIIYPPTGLKGRCMPSLEKERTTSFFRRIWRP